MRLSAFSVEVEDRKSERVDAPQTDSVPEESPLIRICVRTPWWSKVCLFRWKVLGYCTTTQNQALKCCPRPKLHEKKIVVLLVFCCGNHRSPSNPSKQRSTRRLTKWTRNWNICRALVNKKRGNHLTLQRPVTLRLREAAEAWPFGLRNSASHIIMSVVGA